MEFPLTFMGGSSVNTDKSYRLIMLSKRAATVLEEILEDKRKDCLGSEYSKVISQDSTFLKFLKGYLITYDQKSEQIADRVYSFVIKEYLDNQNPVNIQKLIAEGQLKSLIFDLKVPYNVQNTLDTLLKDHIYGDKQVFPQNNRLKNFIFSKIPDLSNYFCYENLEDYIALFFYIFSGTQEDYSLIEIQLKIEKNTNEDEIVKYMLFFLQKQLAGTQKAKEKLKLTLIIYEDILELVGKIPKTYKKNLNRVLHLFTNKLLDFLNEILSNTDTQDDLNYYTDLIHLETILKKKIIYLQYSIADNYNNTITKISNIEEQIQNKDQDTLLLENTHLKQEIQEFFNEENSRSTVSDIYAEIDKHQNKSLANISRLKEINQELYTLNEMYDYKTMKLKNWYGEKFGIQELLESDYLDQEKNTFFREIELGLQRKTLQLDIETFELEKAQRLKAVENSVTLEVPVSDGVVFCLIFVCLGILIKMYLIN